MGSHFRQLGPTMHVSPQMGESIGWACSSALWRRPSWTTPQDSRSRGPVPSLGHLACRESAPWDVLLGTGIGPQWAGQTLNLSLGLPFLVNTACDLSPQSARSSLVASGPPFLFVSCFWVRGLWQPAILGEGGRTAGRADDTAAAWPRWTLCTRAAAGVWGPVPRGPVHGQVANPGTPGGWLLVFPPDAAPPFPH